MIKDLIRLVQRHLANAGFYVGKIDGDRGPKTDAATKRALGTQTNPPFGWESWSNKRQFIAYLQSLCHDAGVSPGPIDGWWGPQTDYASGALLVLETTGAAPGWRDIEPTNTNPNGWPTEQNVTSFYGPHGAKDWSRPPPKLVKVTSPFTYKIAWTLSQKRTYLWAHEKTAASVGRVLANIMAHYGEAEIERLGLNIFSGDYHPRLKKGSTKEWSMHAWGIAYDFDDTRNQLKWGADKASLAHPDCEAFWKIWEAEGWVSLGRSKNSDWMHIQAAKL